MLSSVQPSDLAAYLRTHGWKRTVQEPGRYSIWASALPGTSLSEVLLPEDSTFADYETRVRELLSTVATLENRSEREVISSVLAVNFDIFRLAAPGSGDTPGTVRLNDGMSLVKRLHNMIEAAACTELDRRVTLPPRRPDEVLNFMQKALLGQTEVGSYVITAHVRIPPDLQMPVFDNLQPSAEAEPFERRAGLRLMSALGALRDAAEESAATGQFEPFGESVKAGVSANLCVAVAGPPENIESPEIAVSAAWAPVRPLAEAKEESSNSVRITSPLMPLISEAAVRLRASSPHENVAVTGFPEVLKLERQQELMGEVVLHAIVPELGSGPRKVRVRLPMDQYEQARDAQGEFKSLSVTGNLVRTGNRWALEDPHGFHVVESSDD